MVHHMEVITEHAATAYVEFLERDSRWQIYGTPRAGVLELVQQMAGDERAPTSQEPFAGFTRLRELRWPESARALQPARGTAS
jgi:hypothetical protein